MIKERDTTAGYHCPSCGLSILNKINIFSMSGNLIKMKCVCGNSELVVQMLRDNKFKITVPCIVCPNSHSFVLSSDTFFQKDIFALSCKFTAINICFIGKGKKVHDALQKNEEELIKTFAAYEEQYEGGLDDFEPDDLLFDDDGLDDLDGFDDFYNEYDTDEFDVVKPDSPYLSPKEESGFILHKNSDFFPDGGENPGNHEEDNIKTEEDNDAKDIDGIENIKINSYQIVAQILDIISRLYDEKKIFCECGDFDGKVVILGNAIHIECKNCGSYRSIKSVNVSDAEYLNEIDALYLDFDD